MNVIGIDVSKRHLDLAMVDERGLLLEEKRIDNTSSAICRTLRAWQRKKNRDRSPLVCLEPTGHYSFGVVKVLVGLGLPVRLAHPRAIQLSGGMQRGKSDPVDAKRIAMYALRFRENAHMVNERYLRMGEFKQLLAFRKRLVKDRAMYRAQRTDNIQYMEKRAKECASKGIDSILRALERSLSKVEREIEAFIANDKELARKRTLAMSVNGVGRVLANEIIAATEGFSRFETARQLVCYIGAAPFERSSGSSVRGKAHVSQMACKPLKSLFHMGAMAAVRSKGDIQDYYNRKIAQGKKPMSVLNAVRGKIIHHIWAVLKSGEPYKPYLQMT